MVEKTLRWLAFANMPLTIEAVVTATAVEINSKDIDPDDVPNEDSLLWWCSSLVTKDERTGILALSHFTVKEFLMDKKLIESEHLCDYYLDYGDSNRILAKVCLTCLGFDSSSQC
jgi:hypothetical protein